jgi:F0F1-type ATP synthase assembly protein I
MTQTNPNQKRAFLRTLAIAWEFGYTITVPLVVLALLGRYLDKKLDSSPWLLVTGILLSIVISSVGLVMKFKKVLQDIEAATKTEQQNPESKKQS